MGKIDGHRQARWLRANDRIIDLVCFANVWQPPKQDGIAALTRSLVSFEHEA